MKVILPGYDGTKKILTANSYFLNKYFPGFDVYFLNYGDFKGKLFCGTYISLDKEQMGGRLAWARYVIQYLETLVDDLIIFADGDFFITHPYNREEYQKLLTEMKNFCDVGYMSCSDDKLYARTAAYIMWDRDFLLEVLKSKSEGRIKTIWKFESRGARYIKKAFDEGRIGMTHCPVLRYDPSSAIAYRRCPGRIAVGEAKEEDIDFLVSNGYLPSKEELLFQFPRINRPIVTYEEWLKCNY